MKKVLAGMVILLALGGVAYLYLRGSNKHLQLVPKNAFMIASVDFRNLTQKADIDKLKGLDWVKALLDESRERSLKDPMSKNFIEVLDHPFSSGINIMSDVYFFAAGSGGPDIGGGVIFDIKDETQFEGSVKKAFPTAEIVSRDGYKFIDLNGMALGWNSIGGIYGGIKGKPDKQKALAFLDSCFKHTESASILSNEAFNKFDKDKGDLGLFLNGSELMRLAKNSKATNAANDPATGPAEETHKDKCGWLRLNFEDDKISLTAHVEGHKRAITKSEKIRDEDLSSKTEDVINIEDAYRMLSGYLNIDKVFTYYLSMPLLINFTNKNKHELTLSFAEYAGKKNSKGYYNLIIPNGPSVNAVENETGFTLTNDDDIAAAIAHNEATGTEQKQASKNKSGPGYNDLATKAYPEAIRTMITDKSFSAGITFMKLFKDLTMTGNQADAEIDLNFNKAKGNTFYRILAQYEVFYEAKKAAEKVR